MCRSTSIRYSASCVRVLTAKSLASATSALAKQMCEDVGPHQHHDIQILDFAHHVWGIDREIGQKILDMRVKLDSRKLYAYRKSESERDLHAPFVDFAKVLHGEVTSRLDSPPEIISDCFWEENDTGKSVMTTWKAQQPSNDTEPNLCIAKHIFEFKHDRYKDNGSFLSQSHKKRLMKAFTSVSNRHPKVRFAPPREVNSERKASPEPESSDGDLHVPEFESRKRRRRSESSSSSTHRPTKRGRFSDKAHLLAYAAECMAATSRRWVSGLLIDTCEVTACYFDRHMVVCSSSFSFDRSPEALALIVYAMSLCNKDHAGFDPHNLPSLFTLPTAEAAQSAMALPVTRVTGSFFDFSFCDRYESAKDARSKAGLKEKDTAEHRRGDKAMVGSHGESVKLSADQEGAERTQNPRARDSACFRVVDFIRQPDELIGRGTAVYKVQRRLSSGTFSDELYALKFSWTVKSRLSEIDAVQHLRTTLPDSSHDHLPDHFFAQSWTAEQLRLPWLNLKLTLNEKNHQERFLRAFTSKFYKKLWESGTIENFKQAWLDCVEGESIRPMFLKTRAHDTL